MNKRMMLLAAIASIALIAGACTSDSSSSTSGSGTSSGAPIDITMWHGYGKVIDNQGQTNFEAKALTDLVDEYNAMNTGVHVTLDYIGSNDHALEKLTVALNGGLQPDITYQYGTSMPQLATAPSVMDLTERVQDPAYNWDDFAEGARAAATVDGQVYGIPALIDNLAIVYNKDLFQAANVDEPTADWTWDDFQAAALQLTDASKQQYGFAFPIDSSEDTVWHYDAMLWEAGGDILNADNTKAAFNEAGGVRALSTLQGFQQDGSLLLDFHPDSGKYAQLFNSGNVGMVITGPWDLSGFPDVNYGVQVMPSFDPGGNHDTIAGPDNWVIFDNGADRVNASWEFLSYLTSPDVILQDSLATSHLPTRASVEEMPGFQDFYTKYPGVGDFVANLSNVKKARPQVPQYPQVSGFLGQAVVSVLLGQAEPQAALDSAAEQSDGVLAIPQ
jgi:multiple sugar transport system substrate-binding protein